MFYNVDGSNFDLFLGSVVLWCTSFRGWAPGSSLTFEDIWKCNEKKKVENAALCNIRYRVASDDDVDDEVDHANSFSAFAINVGIHQSGNNCSAILRRLQTHVTNWFRFVAVDINYRGHALDRPINYHNSIVECEHIGPAVLTNSIPLN